MVLHKLYADKNRMNALIDKGDLAYADESKMLQDLDHCCEDIEFLEAIEVQESLESWL